jgi:DNA-directed RNA polymerase subunit RPC12/RpoP
MQVSMYIYASKEPPETMTWYHCLSCKRPLFKANSSKILISNAYGASFTELPPSSNYIEYVCHSCKTVYSILFQ